MTAYPCADGPPVDGEGNFTKADLNFNGSVLPAMSNRLVTTADVNGDVCFYTSTATALVVDVNATADEAITPIDNQRTDTRTGQFTLAGDGVLKINVPEAVGGRTVFGNLASAQAVGPGFATAFPCLDGPPVDNNGNYTKADLNYNGSVLPAMSNRLITTADANGDVCIFASTPTALVVDINAIADEAITPIDNQRTDTRLFSFS